VQSVDLTVAPNEQPVQVRFERWRNANHAKVHRRQPFGGTPSTFREFKGFRLPTTWKQAISSARSRTFRSLRRT